MQADFQGGYLAETCACKMTMIVPKGDGKDLRGIGLVEVLWKSTTGIIN